jgi:hypothetical protein
MIVSPLEEREGTLGAHELPYMTCMQLQTEGKL